MLDTSDDTTMTAHEIDNLRFLIEHQLDVIACLERQGLDLHAASGLLTKLMRRDEELRRHLERPTERSSFEFEGVQQPPTHSTGKVCAPRGFDETRFGFEGASPIRHRLVAPAV